MTRYTTENIQEFNECMVTCSMNRMLKYWNLKSDKMSNIRE